MDVRPIVAIGMTIVGVFQTQLPPLSALRVTANLGYITTHLFHVENTLFR